MIKILSILIIAVAAAPHGCHHKKEPADSGSYMSKVEVETADASSEACTREALRAAALATGTRIMGGVTTQQVVTIATISKNPEAYKGKTVRIEGKIVDICAGKGCWVAIDDGSGDPLKLKVKDGAHDFRKLAVAGQFAIGEGEYQKTGPHGGQVKITGAMIGKVVCR